MNVAKFRISAPVPRSVTPFPFPRELQRAPSDTHATRLHAASPPHATRKDGIPRAAVRSVMTPPPAASPVASLRPSWLVSICVIIWLCPPITAASLRPVEQGGLRAGSPRSVQEDESRPFACGATRLFFEGEREYSLAQDGRGDPTHAPCLVHSAAISSLLSACMGKGLGGTKFSGERLWRSIKWEEVYFRAYGS
jgi:hypothetical protein